MAYKKFSENGGVQGPHKLWWGKGGRAFLFVTPSEFVGRPFGRNEGNWVLLGPFILSKMADQQTRWG